MKRIQTSAAPQAIGPYSQAIQVGDMVFTSGQIPLTPEGKLVEGGIVEQTHQVMKNLQAVLQAAGTDLNKVVKTTIFLADMEDFQQVNEVYAQYFEEPHPARSCVQAACLPKDVRVEIEAVAIVD